MRRPISRCRHPVFGLIAMVAFAAGCPQGPPFRAGWQTGGSEPPATRPTPEAPTRHDPIAVALMHRRLARVTAARDAVIEGDDAAARSAVANLPTELRAAAPPPSWVPFVDALANEAVALQATTDSDQVAASVARLAAGCGDCHDALGVQPLHDTIPALPNRSPSAEIAEEMRWHVWSVDRMWEGLIAPSPDRWVRGTATFSTLPGCASRDRERDDGSQTDPCAITHALAQRAHLAADPDARAAAYGRLLASCESCHRQSREAAVRRPR